MKITGNEAAISAVPSASGADAAATRSADASADKGLQAAGGLDKPSSLHLSHRVGEAEKVADLAKETPEFRAEVVEQAKADLAAGTLTADPAALAEQIFADLF